MPNLSLVVNEKKFSVQVGRHKFMKARDITLHASFYCHNEYHYEKLKHITVMVTWSGNADIRRKTISELNHIM